MNRVIDSENFNDVCVEDVGYKAGDFVLKNQKGLDWRLSDYLGQVVVLLFYPKNETLVCTKQLCSLRDNWKDYLETKAVIVGISDGSVEEHLDFGTKYRLPLTLLADTDRTITKKYSFHWIFPVSFVRVIVIIDARGIILTRKIMLRAFRPADRNVIASIHGARADASNDKYSAILDQYRGRNR